MLSYWTIPYVCINDRRLTWLYNLGFGWIVSVMFTNIFMDQQYLESDTLHGIARLRLKTPKNHVFDEQNCGPESSISAGRKCVRWDADELGRSYSSDSLFVATRIKEIVEKASCAPSSDENETTINSAGRPTGIDLERLYHKSLKCGEYERVGKLDYYPVDVEHQQLSVTASAEAIVFCGALETVGQKCPYVYSTKHKMQASSFGELVRVGTAGGDARVDKDPPSTVGPSAETSDDVGSTDAVIRRIPPEKKLELPLGEVLRAAGVSDLDAFDLDGEAHSKHGSDGDDEEKGDSSLRSKGSVFVITVKFITDDHNVTLWQAITHDVLPTKYQVSVQRLPLSDSKVREVIHHWEEPGRNGGSFRRVRVRRGLHFKVVITGSAKRFSLSKLTSEVVLKFGLLGIWGKTLDFIWQYVFPLVVGVDYSDKVYRSVS
eukprot:TRINITY_DN124122_c0_g1_i1.p1 TRINITY_DN124122_c0_g1~~TRINITY_DN124122_c0_g1_i1.p1  ORF type:complete len:432 (-),score=13.89 TRINITY_DN124122_c0_g1_i1:43-1338(-)